MNYRSRSDADELAHNHECKKNHLGGDCFSCKATINRHGINTYKYGKREPFKETVLNRMKFNQFFYRNITKTIAISHEYIFF